MYKFLIIVLILQFLGNTYASDLDENGIDDRFDTIINPLPTAVMRVSGKQLVFSIQELIEHKVALPLKDETKLMLALNHLIANECFEHARITSNSTINNNLFWFAIVQLAASDEERTSLQRVLEGFNSDLIKDANPQYDGTYKNLSPFNGQFSGCDHLN